MQKTASKAKTTMISLCACLLLVAVVFGFAACGGPATIYKADFSSADSDAFSAFDGSTVTVDATDKIATIGASADDRGANTFFGNNETKNTAVDFSKAVVSVKVQIDSTAMAEGQGFIWSVATNQKLAEDTETYLQANETMVYFLHTAEGVKVAHDDIGSSAETIVTATSQADAVVIEDGWYEIRYTYVVTEDNVVRVDIAVVNEDGDAVYEKQSTTPVGPNPLGDDLKVDELAGLRYGWFCYMSVDSINVSELTVTQ